MKHILTYFREHWRMIIVTLSFLIIFLVLQCTGNSIKNTQKVLYETELKVVIARQADSINTARNIKEVARLDSLQKTHQAEVTAAKTEANVYQALASGYKKEAEKSDKKVDDLLAQYGDSINEPCREIVAAYHTTVTELTLAYDAKQEEVNELNIALTEDSIGWQECKQVNIVKDNTIASKETTLGEERQVNETLRKQLAKQNNFFNKNKTWIAGACGFILGVLLLK